MDWASIGALIVAVGVPLGLGFTSGFFAGAGGTDWYKSLNKPPWTPPNWAFPVIWTALYIIMGIASWLVWKRGGVEAQTAPLSVYIGQLILNLQWTPLFFGLHRVGFALADILLLWVAILVTIFLFWHVNQTAAYLLIPYIIWVTLAASINLYVWLKNPHKGRPGYQDISKPPKKGKSS